MGENIRLHCKYELASSVTSVSDKESIIIGISETTRYSGILSLSTKQESQSLTPDSSIRCTFCPSVRLEELKALRIAVKSV